jgi:hypothetical protein
VISATKKNKAETEMGWNDAVYIGRRERILYRSCSQTVWSYHPFTLKKSRIFI